MSPIPEPIQKHVPAWKKLGLKLKFAKEEPEDVQLRQNGTPNRKKRKASAEEEDVVEHVPIERSAKKPKTSKPRAKDSEELVNGYGSSSYEPRNDGETRKKVKKSKQAADESAEAIDDNSKPPDEPTNAERASKKVKKSRLKADHSTESLNGKPGNSHEQESSPPPALRTTPASKRKSVSFTPDTKTKDGDSVKGLYKTWLANQIATDPSFDPSTVSPALRSVIPSIVTSLGSPSPSSLTSTSPPTLEPTNKNNKKLPKKPKARLPKTSIGPGPSRFDPVLTYLTAHSTSPQTWKFSKPHQNQILKHLFSLAHIPSSYDTALLPYIRGLKGTSARSRVRKEALAIREQDDKWLASEPPGSEKMENETVTQCIARRRRDYEAAVARIKQTLREREEEREARDWELLGEKEEWEARIRKRRRAEIVLWNVGEKEEVVEGDSVAALPQQDTSEGYTGRQMNSGMAQLAQAARDPGPAPRVGRGVGMGMGGVEMIDAGGIAKSSRGKKVVFSDDGAAQTGGSNRVNGFDTADGAGRAGGANGVHKVKAPDLSAANGVKPKRKRKRKRRTGVPDDDESSSSSSSNESSSEDDKKEETTTKKQRTGLKNATQDSSDDETSSSGSSSGSSSSEDSDSD